MYWRFLRSFAQDFGPSSTWPPEGTCGKTWGLKRKRRRICVDNRSSFAETGSLCPSSSVELGSRRFKTNGSSLHRSRLQGFIITIFNAALYVTNIDATTPGVVMDLCSTLGVLNSALSFQKLEFKSLSHIVFFLNLVPVQNNLRTCICRLSWVWDECLSGNFQKYPFILQKVVEVNMPDWSCFEQVCNSFATLRH